MAKLKTLKQLTYIIEHDCSYPPIKGEELEDFNDVSVGTLRKEAIKWIKALEESHKEWSNSKKHGLSDTFVFVDYNEDQLIGFIKHFFNVTEEDLK